MKKILLFVGLMLAAAGLISCGGENGAGDESDEQTTLEFAAFSARTSGAKDDLDADGIKSFRIIVFKTGSGKVVHNSEKQLLTDNDESYYKLTLKLSMYDFVFITDEPESLKEMLDDYNEDSQKKYDDFKNEVIDASLIDLYLSQPKSLVKVQSCERVSIYRDGGYSFDNGATIKTGKWKILMSRPYIRADLNFFLDAAQAAEFEKGQAVVNDKNKIFFGNVPSGVLFGGGSNRSLGILDTDRTVLHFKTEEGSENFIVSSFDDYKTKFPAYGDSGWKLFATTVFLPENILTDKTVVGDAARLSITINDVTRTVSVYNSNVVDDYNLYRNHRYIFNCTVSETDIDYDVTVYDWEKADMASDTELF